MAKFGKHVKIGSAAGVMEGVERGLIKAAQKDDRILAVLEDLSFPGIDWFSKNAPESIIECGIAEANGTVVAAGLAAEGFIPFLYGFIFATFGRAQNQIRQSILVDRLNVKILGRESAWGTLGVSHNTIEGLGLGRIMPNLVIVNPADVVEAEKATMAIADYVGPVLLRIEIGGPDPRKIFTDDYPFDIGRAYVVKDGKDATIIATGYMLSEAIQASKLLEKDGIDVRIVNMSTIKPLDDDAIIKAAKETGAIVTAENHSIMCGLGEAVATVLAENVPTPLVRVGVEDEFSQSGKVTGQLDDLKLHFGLSAEDLALSVKECIAKRDRLQHRRPSR